MGTLISHLVGETYSMLLERDRLPRWAVWRRFRLSFDIELNYDRMTPEERRLVGKWYSDHLDIVRSQ